MHPSDGVGVRQFGSACRFGGLRAIELSVVAPTAFDRPLAAARGERLVPCAPEAIELSRVTGHSLVVELGP